MKITPLRGLAVLALLCVVPAAARAVPIMQIYYAYVEDGLFYLLAGVTDGGTPIPASIYFNDHYSGFGGAFGQNGTPIEPLPSGINAGTNYLYGITTEGYRTETVNFELDARRYSTPDIGVGSVAMAAMLFGICFAGRHRKT
jgi:hypothetical protein